MDIFGTVVGAIKLATDIVGYLRAVRDADEDCLKLLSEVSALGALLDILHRRLANTTGDRVANMLVKAGIGDPLSRCCQDLKPIAAELASTTPHTPSASFTDRLRRLNWPFRHKEIKSTLSRIERLKSLISLTFQTSLIEFIDEARNELAVVGLDVEGVKSVVSALETEHQAHMKKTELLQTDLQALGFVLRGSANSIAKIENRVAVIEKNQQVIKDVVCGQELQDILKWLSPLDFSEQHNTAFYKHAPGTGTWFLENPKFVAWRRGEYNTLWCPGNPGVGKSVMASLVVHELRKAIPEDVAVVFIYFEYEINYTTMQLIEALLKQLAQRRISREGVDSLRKHMAGNRPLCVELLAILSAELQTYKRVFAVIDALDETTTQVWAPLLGSLRDLPGVSLLATSRDLGDIAVEFGRDVRLDVMADEGDMRTYIKARLSGSTGPLKRLLENNVTLRGEIVTGILKRADGMFLLAQLHMNSLETKSRATDLRRALAALPGDLKATYDEATKRIGDQDRELAYHIFYWLIHAVRPLTLSDLRYALAVEDGMTALDTCDLYDEAYLTSICLGLVSLRERATSAELEEGGGSGKIVGFVHYTTQEYFLRDHSVSMYFPHPTHLAVTCLRYLFFDIFATDEPHDEDSKKQLTDIPFVNYAIFSWGKHASEHCEDETIRELAMRLLHDRQRVAVVGAISCYARNVSAIHLCTSLGPIDYLKCLLDDGLDPNAIDSDGDTAITYAAIEGRTDIMRLLLGREGVDINPKGWNGATPLIRAVMQARQGVVELLLTRGDVDVNSLDDDEKTPISHAVEFGHTDIVGLLLARDDVDINTQDKDMKSPLIHAVECGHLDIAKLLLARDDVDVDLRDDGEKAPIAHAAEGGHVGIVELLLARGDVDINSQDAHGCTPLALAIPEGHETVVQLLLQRDDLDISLRDKYGDTHLTLAAGFGNARIAKLLLDKGDDVNSRSHGGKAPLSLAARRGHEDFVKLLLAQDGIHVNPVDSKGYTPLDWAEKRCDSVNIVKLFREAGGRTGRELREGSREGSVKEETLANTPLVTASR